MNKLNNTNTINSSTECQEVSSLEITEYPNDYTKTIKNTSYKPEKCEHCDSYECTLNCKRKPTPAKPNRTELKCGTPTQLTISNATIFGHTKDLTTITLDTKGLEKPAIKLDFTANIIGTALLASLEFQIFKLCKGEFNPIPVGAPWTYSRVAEISEADAFSFYVCDCNSSCDDYCTYTVRVSTSSVKTVGTISINNATLSALIVENSCNC